MGQYSFVLSVILPKTYRSEYPASSPSPDTKSDRSCRRSEQRQVCASYTAGTFMCHIRKQTHNSKQNNECHCGRSYCDYPICRCCPSYVPSLPRTGCSVIVGNIPYCRESPSKVSYAGMSGLSAVSSGVLLNRNPAFEAFIISRSL